MELKIKLLQNIHARVRKMHASRDIQHMLVNAYRHCNAFISKLLPYKIHSAKKLDDISVYHDFSIF